MAKVYIVTYADCEGYSLKSATVHLDYEGALHAWNQLRLRLLKEYENHTSDGWGKFSEDCIIALQCEDPTKIDNYPHETPILEEMKIQPPLNGESHDPSI